MNKYIILFFLCLLVSYFSQAQITTQTNGHFQSMGGNDMILRYRPDISDSTYMLYFHADKICYRCYDNQSYYPNDPYNMVEIGATRHFSLTDTCSHSNTFIKYDIGLTPARMVKNPFTGDSTEQHIFKTCSPQYPFIVDSPNSTNQAYPYLKYFYQDTFLALKDYWIELPVQLPTTCGYWQAQAFWKNTTINYCNISTVSTSHNLLYATNIDTLKAGNFFYSGNTYNWSQNLSSTCHISNLVPNSNPYFLSNPSAFYFKNTPSVYHQNAIDPDGDSLVFTSISPVFLDTVHGWQPQSFWWPYIPKECPNGNAVYNYPGAISSGLRKVDYACAKTNANYPTCVRYDPVHNPFDTDSTFFVNPQNGDISFTGKSSFQSARLDIRCDEYRQGVWVGAVNRSVRIFVTDSTHSVTPTLTIDTANLLGCAIDTNYVFYACKGNQVTIPFDIKTSSAITNLVVSDNHNFAIPSASVIYQNNKTDSVHGNFTWQTTLLDTGWHNMLITVYDSTCSVTPYMQKYTFVFKIYISGGIDINQKDTTICEGNSLPLYVNNLGAAMQWSILSGTPNSLSCTTCFNPIAHPIQTTTYVVQGSNSGLLGCKLNDTIVVKVIKKFSIQATDTTLCQNKDAMLKANATSSNSPLLYSWSPTTGIIGGSNNASITIMPNTIQYTVTVKDTMNCFVLKDTSTVVFDNTFSPNITIDKSSICTGDTAAITVTGAVVSSWQPNYHIDYSNLNSVKVWPDSSVLYQAKVKSLVSSCTTTLYENISVTALRADAGPDKDIFDGDAITLGGSNMLCNNGCNVRWYPDLYLLFDFYLNPLARPHQTMKYWVVLSNDAGTCVSRDTMQVNVKCTDIYIPNVFNPSSQNDETRYFGPRNVGLDLDYFRIYNRWGELVFETRDCNIRWNGSYNGNPQPLGVYVWMIKGKCPDGQPIEKKGNVTLIR